MSRIVALGEAARVAGFALAGVEVIAAEEAAAVIHAWERLTPDAGVLILSPTASSILESRLAQRPALLTVVMPR